MTGFGLVPNCWDRWFILTYRAVKSQKTGLLHVCIVPDCCCSDHWREVRSCECDLYNHMKNIDKYIIVIYTVSTIDKNCLLRETHLPRQKPINHHQIAFKI